MTIGIAAFGPNAGSGVIGGLRAVERIARGAIGGFVSLAAITEDGRLLRASIQVGGAGALFGDTPPAEIAQARIAGVISSGPDRPEPLSDFISAAPGIGIVTGHRMPQTRVEGGIALNALILAKMQSGADPQQAVDQVIAQYPDMDAGFLACSTDGRFGMANTPAVLARGDQASGVLRDPSSAAQVASIHNAIFPHRLVASLANEVAMETMLRSDAPTSWIRIPSGISLEHGPRARIDVGADGTALRVIHHQRKFLTGSWSMGLGDRVAVMSRETQLGWLGYEPFMTLVDGKVRGIDGQDTISVPVLNSLPFEDTEANY